MTITETELALRKEIVELKSEIDALKAQVEGDIPRATHWLQTKVWRQRRELDNLNRKVSTQRFRLKLLASLGRDVSFEEYAEAKKAIEESNPRVGDYEKFAA